jgi:outer membrane protein OmpA-like peptidoglycan-associated protein
MERWNLFASLAGALTAATLAAAPAGAQERVDEPIYPTVEAGVTAPLNDPVEDQFEAGGDGALGLYFSLAPEVALGARVMAGALAEGSPVPQDPVERGVGDYGLIAPSIRVHPFASLMDTRHRAAGLYVAASPGVGIFDGEVVPGYSTSLGYNFAAGPIAIGPRARFTHFIETEGRFGDNDVLMLTGGLEVAILDEAEVVPPEPVAVVDAPPEPELELEPAPEPAPSENPALILDQRAYFDYDQAEIRPAVEDELDAVAAHYRDWGDRYRRLVISGHADDRGSAKYNEHLSAARALAVANHLVSEGVPVEVMELQAHGETEPLEPNAETPRQHQLNRRVELDLVWAEGQRPEGLVPEASPNAPSYVDEAPERVRERERAWDHAQPGPGTSEAEAMLARERERLHELVDRPVRVDLGDRDPTGARPIEVAVEAER